MTSSDIGPLKTPRRGISIRTFLLWIILAGIGGGVAWGVYGNEVRSRPRILPYPSPTAAVAPLASAAPPASSGAPANDEIVDLLKDLQASQKRTADQLETALQLLISEQATSKATDDAMAALSAKVDRLQRPTMAVVAKKPAPAALPKPPGLTQPPAVVSPAPVEPEPSDAATSLRR
jgi:hypothetical protein